MKLNKLIIATSIIVMGSMACKKDKLASGGNNNNTPKVSRKALLEDTWVLSETYEDDVQKTKDGTGQYKFTDGQFQYLYNGNWTVVGTYQWNDTDSNSISVLLTGASMSYWWYIKKLDEHNYNTEFNANGKKFNYNYTR